MSRTKVVNDETVEILASDIKTLSEGVNKLLSGRMNEKALLLLIEYACTPKVGKKQIKAVLNALQSLEQEYLNA